MMLVGRMSRLGRAEIWRSAPSLQRRNVYETAAFFPPKIPEISSSNQQGRPTMPPRLAPSLLIASLSRFPLPPLRPRP